MITLGGRRRDLAPTPAILGMRWRTAAADGTRPPSGSKSARSPAGNWSVIRTVPSPLTACHHDETSTQCGLWAIWRSCRVAQLVENAYWPRITQNPSQERESTPWWEGGVDRRYETNRRFDEREIPERHCNQRHDDTRCQLRRHR